MEKNIRSCISSQKSSIEIRLADFEPMSRIDSMKAKIRIKVGLPKVLVGT